jgi:hypothetical protein
MTRHGDPTLQFRGREEKWSCRCRMDQDMVNTLGEEADDRHEPMTGQRVINGEAKQQMNPLGRWENGKR